MPIMAQTAIKTSSEGLTTGQTTFEVNGFKVLAYHAAPAGKTNLPVILVVQEIFGVHEYIADTLPPLCKSGLSGHRTRSYARQGDAAKYTEMSKLMSELVAKVPDAQVMADLDGAVKWAGSNGGNLKKVGINGFCWGGRIVWLYSEQSKNVKAGVAWYGRLVGTPSAMSPTNPLDLAADLKAPVLGLYGGQDGGIPLTTINQMKDALAEAASKGNKAAAQTQFVVYPQASHAFHADYRPSYRKEVQDGRRSVRLTGSNCTASPDLMGRRLPNQ